MRWIVRLLLIVAREKKSPKKKFCRKLQYPRDSDFMLCYRQRYVLYVLFKKGAGGYYN